LLLVNIIIIEPVKSIVVNSSENVRNDEPCPQKVYFEHLHSIVDQEKSFMS